MAVKDLQGSKFGKLSVLGRIENAKDGSARWLCRCECGQEREIHGTGLRAGRHKSCGCSSPRFTTERVETHGKSRTRTYRIWLGMHARCSDKCHEKSRHLYFEKGIRVCERWGSFEKFFEDMGECPEGFSIERIDGNGGYEPGNCKWATKKEQANNVSTNSLIQYQGETKTLSMWADEIGIKANTLLYRIRRGIPLDRAMQKEIGHIKSVEAKSRERPCMHCGKLFTPRPAQVRNGTGLFCSQACNGASRRRR